MTQWVLLALLAITTVCTAVLLGGLALLATERGRPIQLEIRGISALARELAAHLLLLASLPLGLFPQGPRRAPAVAGARTPVLLVPGYGDNHTAMAPMAMYLRARGWPWVQAINHAPFSAPVAELAQNLGARVEELKQASGESQVDLVCHSMGGVVATWYMNHLDGAGSVRQMVALATPFQGTKVAVFGRRRQANDLLPLSQVIKNLGQPPVPTTAIRSTFDTVILPPDSAALPEDSPTYKNQEVHWHGHHAMLISSEVLALVSRALEPES